MSTPELKVELTPPEAQELTVISQRERQALFQGAEEMDVGYQKEQVSTLLTMHSP